MQTDTLHALNRRAALAGTAALGLGLVLAGCGGGNTEAAADPPVAPTLAISSDTPGVAAAAFKASSTSSVRM